MENRASSEAVKGIGYSLVSSLLLGMVFIFSRLAQETMPLSLFIFWWFAAAVLWVPAVLLFLRPDRRRWRSLLARHWRFFIAYNLIEGVGNVFFFHLIRVIHPSVVAFFNSLSPFFGALIAFFYLRERLRPGEWLGGSISVAGVVIITYVSPQVGLLPAALAVLMTTLYSLGNTLVKKVVGDVPPLLIVLVRIFFLAAGFSLVMAIGGGFRWPAAREAALVAAGTLSGPALGMYTLFASLKYLKATYVFLLRNIQPFIVVAAAALFLRQPFSGKQLAGGLLVVAGISLMLLARRFSAADQAPVLPLSDPGD